MIQRSEVARFRQQQALEEEAARQALYGFAVVASHEIITARMEQEAPRLVRLLQERKIDQAEQLIEDMQRECWGPEKGEIVACYTTSREGE